ncbi:MAG: MBL fold metallo-hydrolase [Candidatus Heimdallarchaeota archaeon]
MVNYTKTELAQFNGTLLFPEITLIRPKDSRQFTSNLIIIDDKVKLVVDTGGFQFKSKRMSAIRDFFKIGSSDVVLFSHYHLDHTMGSHSFSESQKVIHSSEKDVLKSMENFFAFGLGSTAEIPEYQEIWKPLFSNILNQEGLSEWADLAFDNIQSIDNRNTLDLGEKELEILHFPGHSPGHCGAYEPFSKILFIGDIDLGLKFGPWYGWVNSDLEAFRKTIDKLKSFVEANEISVVIPSHSSPIEKAECLKRLEEFGRIFDKRKKRIFEFIDKNTTGTTVGEIVSQSIIHQGKTIHFWEFFEQVMVEKHLIELELEESIFCEGDQIFSA